MNQSYDIAPEEELHRTLPDGRGLWVEAMLYTTRITVGPIGSPFVDDAWCYHTRDAALAAADAWDPETEPEPDGWHRHPNSGRRRDVPRPA